MCLPAVVAGYAGTGVSAAGLGLSAAGARNQSKFNKAAYDYQATMGEYRAQDALERGRQNVFAHGLKVGQLKGTQRARFAAAGLDLTEGSAANILADTDFMAELDRATIEHNAEKEAWALRADASLLRARADAEDPTGAYYSTLLGGAGQVAQSWYRYSELSGTNVAV